MPPPYLPASAALIAPVSCTELHNNVLLASYNLQCSSASGGGKQDSVLLLYSRHCSGSVEWARYLHKLFTELSRNKSRLTVRHLPVEVQIFLSSQYNII